MLDNFVQGLTASKWQSKAWNTGIWDLEPIFWSTMLDCFYERIQILRKIDVCTYACVCVLFYSSASGAYISQG